MSVTFSGAFTFTGGGFTATLAPPPSEATATWFGGGFVSVYTSLVGRITYATDTATATVRGPLSIGRQSLAATGNTTYGWFGGGQDPGQTSVVDRITYSIDTATASVRGPIISTYQQAATGNTTDGWFAGGAAKSTVSRITYATDTATATARGPLNGLIARLAATGTSTDGWFAAGYLPGYVVISTVQRITYATDTATATTRGPLSSSRYGLAATGDSTTYGWFGGGLDATGTGVNTSTVQRITYATDTATASVRGPLSSVATYFAAGGNSTAGWFGGGYTGSPSQNPSVWAKTSTINKITYATDTATASIRGPLSVAECSMGASSGIQ